MPLPTPQRMTLDYNGECAFPNGDFACVIERAQHVSEPGNCAEMQELGAHAPKILQASCFGICFFSSMKRCPLSGGVPPPKV